MNRAVRLGLVAAVVALCAHATALRFLCDDAFISFRYAHNLASGHGLVFNPGHERVEGFTNPLWVLILAAFDLIGMRPEAIASVLSLLFTAALGAVVARASLLLLPDTAPRWLALLPVSWLALTRSFAVWGTSGLETRLYELLTVAGVVELILVVRRASLDEPVGRPWAAVLLGLAAWTRPDGLMIGGIALVTTAVLLLARRRLPRRAALVHAATFAAIVAALFAARVAYYGHWLPNTYYAKIDGKTWWGMGGRYLAAFALEYGVIFWLPALALALAASARLRRWEVPALLCAALVPQVLYVASIGGDHFEYRPLDLCFPLVFVLMMLGVATLKPWIALVYAALVGASLLVVPAAAAREFPSTYAAGFPGFSFDRIDASEYLDPARDPVTRLPGVRRLAQAHRALTRTLTRRFAAIRREEHVLFRAGLTDEARRLEALVRDGVLPSDTHVAIGSVGVIPYVSGLRTLDRFGLTDADVARRPAGTVLMAHEKVATFEMAQAKAVDLWAVDPVHLLFREDDPALVERAAGARGTEDDAVFAEVGKGWWLLARAPAGIDALARRMPRLAFLPVADDDAFARLAEHVVAATADAPARRARALDVLGRDEEALEAWRAGARAGDPDAMLSAARREAASGRDGDALGWLEKLTAAHPHAAPGWYLRGVLLARGERGGEAVDALRRAIEAEPEDDDARYALTLALVLSGRNDDADRELERLDRRRPDLAERIRAARSAP